MNSYSRQITKVLYTGQGINDDVLNFQQNV